MAKSKAKNLKVFYDREVDALSIVVREGREEEFDEIAPGVGVERNSKGEIIGFEILDASRHFRSMLPKMTQYLERQKFPSAH